jgi:hypothetical protein
MLPQRMSGAMPVAECAKWAMMPNQDPILSPIWANYQPLYRARKPLTSWIWFVLAALVGLVMWAARVPPDQAVTNLDLWLRRLGVENPPTWLRDRATDRRVRRVASIALLLLLGWGGAILHSWFQHRVTGTETATPTTTKPEPESTSRFLVIAGSPFAGRAVVGGPYLREEINKMIEAVSKLSDIMHLDIKPTFDAAISSINNWAQQAESERDPAFAKKLALAADKLTDTSNQIDQILSDNARYDNEIRLTVRDRDAGPFVRELAFFSSDISATVDLRPEARAVILKNDLTRLQKAIITYDNWVYAATDNADYKIQALRAYKPSG